MGDWFVGEIRNFSFNVVPSGWHLCDGSVLPINQYTALFSLLGTAYGGDGRTTFALPDLRGRVMVSKNNAKPDDYTLGKTGGAETVALTAAQLPAHNHNFACRQEAGTVGAIANNFVSSSGASAQIATPQPLYAVPVMTIPPTMISLNPGSIDNTGDGVVHANMQPFLVTNFCIAMTGLYPPRD